MTRKHFEALAAAMLRVKPTEPKGDAEMFEMYDGEHGYPHALVQWKAQCRVLADACQDSNDRFNYWRFLEACGVEQ